MSAILWFESYARTFSLSHPCTFKYLLPETEFECMPTNQLGFYKMQACVFSHMCVCVFVVMNICHRLFKSLCHITLQKKPTLSEEVYVYILYSNTQVYGINFVFLLSALFTNSFQI
jgi:hypothetical protein